MTSAVRDSDDSGVGRRSDSRGSNTAPMVFGQNPVLVRRSEATRSLWGDEESGQIADLFYGHGEQLSGVIFSLGPGHRVGASEKWKPVPMDYEHRFFYVLRGTLATHNPETGDIAVAGPGEAITWRGGQFHFAYNVGQDEVVALDWFAPVERPVAVAESAWSEAKRPLLRWEAGRYDLLERWPDGRGAYRDEAVDAGVMTTVSPRTALHFIHGTRRPQLMSILASSPDLTVGTFTLRAGTHTEPEQHPGDEVIFATVGRLHVHLPDTRQWFEMEPLDCLFIPGGTPHEYWSYGDDTVQAVFGVAPRYR